jgi:RimJ/RimL family protein N-acetyltransferase
MNQSSIKIELISEEHIVGFHEAVDLVAKEGKYLARIQAPPIADAIAFANENIAKGNAHYLAMDGSKVIGWCDIVPMKKEVFSHCGVLGMGIIDGYRGKGIGKRIVKAALDKAKSNGLERVELEVFHTNVDAIALYEKVGFHTEGRKRKAAKLNGEYLDTIQMALFLDDYGEWKQGLGVY